MASAPSRYWQAQRIARALQRAFASAHEREDRGMMRESFYHLAYFETRTLAILRSALDGHREALARAALHNLIVLHTTLRAMHHAAPEVASSTVNHLREARLRLIDDLIIEWLEESSEPVQARALAQRVAETQLLAGVREPLVRLHLDDLVASGQVVASRGGFTRTRLPFHADNFDELGLHALMSESLARQLQDAGFHGLIDVAARRGEFRAVFRAVTGFEEHTAALFVSAAAVLEEPEVTTALSPWPHADLIHSTFPRPYQHEAYAVFRGHGYQGQVIEAPAGSGKTLIGMMCVQDWLRSLALGETILVLVPTMNYERQWLDELCIKPAGLRLPSGLIHAGTPADLSVARTRSGISPCVLVMTYTAFSHAGSGVGKGGFDQDSVEMFLQENNVQYIILDEVHKIVEDPRGVSADVARVFVDWLADGSLRGLIGFSGTAALYRGRLHELGLDLAFTVPAHDLIARGYVAPFAEIGVPYAYSAREQRIRDLLDAYKSCVRAFAKLAGGTTLRRWFAAIPMTERVAAARDLLGMYAGRPDHEPAITRRLAAWETGNELTLAELPLISLIQLAWKWSDERMVLEACAACPARDRDATRAGFQTLLDAMTAIRAELRTLIRHAGLLRRLAADGFGTSIDAPSLGRTPDEVTKPRERATRTKDALASTIAGLYAGLREWYGRAGEGRVDTIKAVIEAEQASRPVRGVIVFDASQRIIRQGQVAAPGYRGIAGVFAEMLDDPRFTPVAVLSSEIYLPHDARHPLTAQIAAYIRRAIMTGELPAALFALITDRLELTDADRHAFRGVFDAAIASYADQLGTIRAARPVAFSRKVLAPLRRAVRRMLAGTARTALLARLTLKHHHVRAWIGAFFDYALVAASFERAPTVDLERMDGRRQTVAIITMPAGRRQQLVYELTARMMDAEDLPVNLAIVSSWARTGWNVITPDVLIDATATRDPIAWQQLRGRAMRPLPSWTADCHRLMMLLVDTHPSGLPEPGRPHQPVGAADPTYALDHAVLMGRPLDQGTAGLLRDVYARAQLHQAGQSTAVSHGDSLRECIERGDLAGLSSEERLRLATELMLQHNKVTHIYELVKASGSTAQIHWDSASQRWLRTAQIAAKHHRETAVSPLSGELLTGPAHAPLVYAGDPRRDIPTQLRSHLEALLRSRDPLIVAGWLEETATTGEALPGFQRD